MRNTDSPENIDAAFVPFLRKIILEEYHYLVPENVLGQKRRFFDTGTVDFVYDHVQTNNLAIYQEDLKRMIDTVEKSTVSETLKQLYLKKFSEQGSILNLLTATATREDHVFAKCAADLYGNPSEGLFWYIASQSQYRYKNFIDTVAATDKVLHQAYVTWFNYYSSLKKPEHESITHTPFYEGIFLQYNDEVHSAEKIHKMFTDYLELLNIRDWTVEIDFPGSRTFFGVNQSKKVISIPHDSDLLLRKDTLTKLSLKALLHHEIGIHVVRRENGEAGPLALLAIGLDKYLRAEEGLATFAEQLISGCNTYAGHTGYLAAGAATGSFGNQLSFFELFNMLYAYFVLSIAKNRIETDGFYEKEEIQLLASEKAWARTLRTFRGTTGTTPGTIYTRDIIYFEGNHDIWQLVGKEPAIRPEWLIGKYDPTNKTHVSALKEFGIL